MQVRGRIVSLDATGGPEVLSLRDEAIPPPGLGEAQVAVRAIGLNRAEALFRRGRYVERPAFPARLGYEAVGTVTELGAEVTGLAVGDRVALVPPGSLTRWGTWAEYVNLPADRLVQLPADLDWLRAGAVWMAAATAYGALVGRAGMATGDIVLINAASSSVGLTAIQIAKAFGAVPVALTRTSAKRDRLLDAGAAHVIATAAESIGERVAAIGDGRGARIGFDPVGGPGLANLTVAMQRGGRIILYGRLDDRPTPLPLLELISRGLTIEGFVFADFAADPANRAALACFVLDGLAAGTLDPVIDSTFALDDVVAANRRLESNEQFDKIMMIVDP